jgi:hypothetical protein
MKKRSRAVVFLLAAAIAVSSALCGGVSAKASSSLPDPRVELSGDASSPASIAVGSLFDLNLTFTHTFDESNDNDSYTNVCNSFSDTDDLYAVIDVTSETGSIHCGKTEYIVCADCTTDDNIKTISFDLFIPQKELKRTGSGFGVLKFKITYYKDANKKDRLQDKSDNNVPSFTAEYQVFSKLADSKNKGEGKLAVQSFRLDHSPIKEGETFSLTVAVKNTGSVPCDHVACVLGLPADSGLSIKGQTDTKNLSSLAAGAAQSFTYPLACLSKMATSSYAATVTLSSDESDEASSKIYIPVTGTKTDKDDTGTVGQSKPQIIVESYDYGGKAVTGGQAFNLSMKIRNTGSIAIENCKMTVGSSSDDKDTAAAAGSVFTPAKSSNTFFIPKIAPGAAVQKSIALLPKTDAAPNSYGVAVTFDYDAVVDNKRQTLNASETITIPLTQPDRFEVGEPETDDQMFVGEDNQLSISYVNKGKSKIYNLAVKLEGNFETKDGDSYIGNLDSGASDNFEASLQPAKAGTLKGTATFTYEDSTGKTRKIVKSFSGEATAEEEPGSVAGAMNGMQGKKGAKSAKSSGLGWKLWLIIGCAAAAGVVVTVILVKRHKAKKRRLLEEADDYDDDLPGGDAK